MSPSCRDLFSANCRKIFESTLTVETGSSDFHKLAVTLLKIKHEKVSPKIIQYSRDYKNFDSTKFFEKFQVRITDLDMNSLDFGSLKKCFIELLNQVAPLKTKFLRAKLSKFVRKDVSKAIMLSTKLRNQFLKKRTLETRTNYIKQRKTKRNYYENLDLKDINDNKKFWATVKPLFSNKIKGEMNQGR